MLEFGEANNCRYRHINYMTVPSLFMAFDFGAKRTGVAVGQEITATARPLTTIASINQQPNWSAIEALVTEWQPTQLVVGIPAKCDQNKSVRKKIINFSQELQQRFNLPVQLHDETLTSDEAYLQLKNKREQIKGKINKADIDQYAAAIILESWMNARPTDPS